MGSPPGVPISLWLGRQWSARVPQVGVLADLCFRRAGKAQVSEYRDLWHPMGEFKLTHHPISLGAPCETANLPTTNSNYVCLFPILILVETCALASVNVLASVVWTNPLG